MAAVHHMSSSLPRPHHPHERVHHHAGPLSHHEKLVKNAQKLVSQTFFGTMLKQMHNSPFKSKIFSGGRGGEAFGSLLDQRLSALRKQFLQKNWKQYFQKVQPIVV